RVGLRSTWASSTALPLLPPLCAHAGVVVGLVDGAPLGGTGLRPALIVVPVAILAARPLLNPRNPGTAGQQDHHRQRAKPVAVRHDGHVAGASAEAEPQMRRFPR